MKRPGPGWLALVRLALPLLGAIGLAVALRDGDRAQTLALLGGHLAWLPLVLLPFLAGMACDAGSLWLVLGGTGQRLRYRTVLRLRVAAEGALFTLPAGSIAAEALKPVLFRRACGVPLVVGATAVLVNKSFIVLTNAVYLLLGLFAGGALLRAALPERWRGLVTIVVLGGALGCLGLAIGLMLAVSRADLLARLIERLPARLRARFSGCPPAVLADTTAFFRDPARLCACFGLTLLHWLIEAFETYAAAHLLGLPIGFGDALAFESLLALLRSLAFFLPGGIGLQDAGHLMLAHLSGAASGTVMGGMLVIVKRSKELLWTAVAALLMPAGAEADLSRPAPPAVLVADPGQLGRQV